MGIQQEHYQFIRIQIFKMVFGEVLTFLNKVLVRKDIFRDFLLDYLINLIGFDWDSTISFYEIKIFQNTLCRVAILHRFANLFVFGQV